MATFWNDIYLFVEPVNTSHATTRTFVYMQSCIEFIHYNIHFMCRCIILILFLYIKKQLFFKIKYAMLISMWKVNGCRGVGNFSFHIWPSPGVFYLFLVTFQFLLLYIFFGVVVKRNIMEERNEMKNFNYRNKTF